MKRVRVALCAPDPMTSTGLLSCLVGRPGLVVVPPDAGADVVVAAVDRLSPQAVLSARTKAVQLDRQAVLIVDKADRAEPAIATENWVAALLPRAAVTDDRIDAAIHAAAGRVVPAPAEEDDMPDPATSSLSAREVSVLRLMADGLTTGEIAGLLRYSERTVKNIVYTITSRLELNNRAHAVAYAIRAGYF